MVSKHIKMWSKLLVFREIQIKTTARYHYKLTRIAQIKIEHMGKDVELELFYTQSRKIQ